MSGRTLSRRGWSFVFATLALGAAVAMPAAGCRRAPPVFAFCVDGETRCAADAVETCAGGIWGAAAACGAGDSCSLGECSDAASCRFDCTVAGTTGCAGGSVVTCGEYDSDACLDLGMAVDCPAGQSCSDGVCGTGCTDECSAGAVSCAGPAATRDCGDFDEDDCLDWSGAVPCPATQGCLEAGGSASCVSAECTDECILDFNWMCVDGGYTACATDGDADPCLEEVVVLCSDGCSGSPVPFECKECCAS